MRRTLDNLALLLIVVGWGGICSAMLVQKSPGAFWPSSPLHWGLLASATLGVVMVGALSLMDHIRRFTDARAARGQGPSSARGLGLDWRDRDAAMIDRSFAFFRRDYRLYRWMVSLLWPTFSNVFVGTWEGRAVVVFDHAVPSPTSRRVELERSTCALVETEGRLPGLTVTWRSMWSRMGRRLRRTPRQDLPGFLDRDFELSGPDASKAADIAVRIGPILDRWTGQIGLVTLELHGSRVLYCAGQMAIDERVALLRAATQVVEALEPQRQ